MESSISVPSWEYRAMVYAAVATIHFYNKDLNYDEPMTLEYFMKNNEGLRIRVFKEILNVFEYELSTHQMDVALKSFLNGKVNPQSIKETEAYELK